MKATNPKIRKPDKTSPETKSETFTELPTIPTDETRRNLELLVDQRRRRDAALGVPPKEIQTISGVISVGDEVKDTVGYFQAITDGMAAKRAKFREEIAPLFHASEQKIECEFHEGSFHVADFELSALASWQPGELVMKYRPCPECELERLVNEKHKRWIERGVPRKVAHATFDNYEVKSEPQKTAVTKAKKQAAKGRGFFIACGNPGNGKSHLASAIMKTIGDGLFITHGNLVDELRNTYEEGGKRKMLSKYKHTPCLILDELEAEFTLSRDSKGIWITSGKGNDIQPLLYSILAYRFDTDLITVLTSNEDIATVLKILGPKLEDRMAMSYSAANFTWESYRRTHREM